MILTLTRAHNYYIHDGRFQGKEGTCPAWGGKCPAAETDGAWSDNPGDGGHDSSSRSFVEICRRRRRSIGPTCVRLFAVAKRPTDGEAIRRRRDESVGRRRPRQLADDARCVSDSAPVRRERILSHGYLHSLPENYHGDICPWLRPRTASGYRVWVFSLGSEWRTIT